MNEDAARCRTVLLVDDDEQFRSGIRRILETLRGDICIKVLEAGTGADAMGLLGNQSVDFVLLDYMLPGGNGLEWLKKILSAHGNVAVIMLTGKGNEEIAVEAMKIGAVDYLVKDSISPVRLHHAITSAAKGVEMLHTIDRQREKLLHAERQRVMIESLATACHHLGQPATAIMVYLGLMNQSEQSPDMQNMISECLKAAKSMADVFTKLQQVSEYRPEPYLLPREGESPDPDGRMLRI